MPYRPQHIVKEFMRLGERLGLLSLRRPTVEPIGVSSSHKKAPLHIQEALKREAAEKRQRRANKDESVSTYARNNAPVLN